MRTTVFKSSIFSGASFCVQFLGQQHQTCTGRIAIDLFSFLLFDHKSDARQRLQNLIQKYLPRNLNKVQTQELNKAKNLDIIKDSSGLLKHIDKMFKNDIWIREIFSKLDLLAISYEHE